MVVVQSTANIKNSFVASTIPSAQTKYNSHQHDNIDPQTRLKESNNSELSTVLYYTINIADESSMLRRLEKTAPLSLCAH
jgi:hypothetical protein